MPELATTLDELDRRARGLVADGARRLLGITGAPGAGKSTLADALAARLGTGLAVVVGMDGFHLPNAELARLGRAEQKGAPDTFDTPAYEDLLRRLRGAEATVWAPRFHRDIEESVADEIEVPASVPLVVTEGNYLLLWPAVREQLDEIWYVELPDEERHRRLTARRLASGVTASEAQQWTKGSDEANARMVRALRDQADLLVDLR